jgi:ankyrin repeat protein
MDIIEAIKNNAVDRVQELLQQDPILVNSVRTVDGSSPLHLAAEFGNPGMVQALIDAGADIYRRNGHGNTPFYEAMCLGHDDVVELMFANALNINAADDEGITALHTAALTNEAELVEFLIARGAAIDARDHAGSTPLHLAALNGNYNIVKLLVSAGSDINIRNKCGWTPLHYATLWQNGNLDRQGLVIEFLFDSGAELDIASHSIWLLLRYAVYVSNTGLIERILSEGGNINTRDDQGLTPLDYAIVAGDTKLIEFLRARGADSKIKVPDPGITSSFIVHKSANGEVEDLRGEVIPEKPKIYVLTNKRFQCRFFLSYLEHGNGNGQHYVTAFVYGVPIAFNGNSKTTEPHHLFIRLKSSREQERLPDLAVRADALYASPELFSLEQNIKFFNFHDGGFVLNKRKSNGSYKVPEQLFFLLERAGAVFNEWGVEEESGDKNSDIGNNNGRRFLISENKRGMMKQGRKYASDSYVYRSAGFNWDIAEDISQLCILSQLGNL